MEVVKTIINYKLTTIFLLYSLFVTIFWLLTTIRNEPILWIFLHSVLILFGLIGDELIRKNYNY